MKEYIEKDTALQDMWNALYALEDQREKLHGLDLFERKNLQDGFEAGQQAIVNCPVADVVEVRHGQWIDMGGFISCSVCSATRMKEFESYYGKAVRPYIRTDYCPSCGAKMDGGTNN